jgi:hypothetical protein
MKKPYQKPTIAIERYCLTQSISSCTSIKINLFSAECVIDDPDSTYEMMNWAMRGGFLGSGECMIDMSGYRNDSVCYHTSVNAAFTS